MTRVDVLVVGAGPAGLSCAESYRESGGEGEVLLIGADPEPPYERPALSKAYLRGEVARPEVLLRDGVHLSELGIQLAPGTKVTRVDPDRRTVTTSDGRDWTYGSLVFATGSRPALPELPGLDHPAARTLRDLADSDALRKAAGARTETLVVGSGFIGCEAAVSIAALGGSVTLATDEEAPQLARVGPEVAERIAAWLDEAGIRVLTGSELSGIEGRGRAVARVGEAEVEADTILLALGAQRNVELAEEAGIGTRGGLISTDEQMRTDHDGVLAIGDVARAHNAAAGRPLVVEHWGEALNHGRVAGAVLAGDDTAAWDVAPGFWSTIGGRTIKQVAWGDGFDRVEFSPGQGEAFTVRYGLGGELVGVITHGADADYERGRELIEARTPWREVAAA